MSEASGGVVSATDAIAMIADQTNEGAARMTSNASTVRRSIESIAAVSEENSAAAEEVSAATEQLSAQVEEVVAAAGSLSQMAAQLAELVGRFVLDDGGRAARRLAPGTRAVVSLKARMAA